MKIRTHIHRNEYQKHRFGPQFPLEYWKHFYWNMGRTANGIFWKVNSISLHVVSMISVSNQQNTEQNYLWKRNIFEKISSFPCKIRFLRSFCIRIDFAVKN